MSQSFHVTVLCGGQSPEHEISILSAVNVINGFNSMDYATSVIYITKSGAWHLLESAKSLSEFPPEEIIDSCRTTPVTLALGDPDHAWVSLKDTSVRYKTDCVFPVLHGTRGEDGTMQGLLELADLPYVGADVLGCALSMEKDIAKQLLLGMDIPTLEWVALTHQDVGNVTYEQITDYLGDTFFVKPVHLGSSIAVSKVRTKEQYEEALKLAFLYDNKVILEKAAVVREIEVSVLGNYEVSVSFPGEIIPHHEFYTYEAKYIDKNGADIITPADVPQAVAEKARELAVETYMVLQCQGMARVDLFLTQENELYVNEVNPIPGFTDISMYSKNWNVSGMSYAELLEALVRLAMERYKQQQAIYKNLEKMQAKTQA